MPHLNASYSEHTSNCGEDLLFAKIRASTTRYSSRTTYPTRHEDDVTIVFGARFLGPRILPVKSKSVEDLQCEPNVTGRRDKSSGIHFRSWSYVSHEQRENLFLLETSGKRKLEVRQYLTKATIGAMHARRECKQAKKVSSNALGSFQTMISQENKTEQAINQYCRVHQDQKWRK